MVVQRTESTRRGEAVTNVWVLQLVFRAYSRYYKPSRRLQLHVVESCINPLFTKPVSYCWLVLLVVVVNVYSLRYVCEARNSPA